MCLGCSHPHLMANAKQSFPTKQPGMTRQRSTEPEIFTFDIPPEVRHTTDISPRLRARRRPVKILYPAQVCRVDNSQGSERVTFSSLEAETGLQFSSRI
ncbi:hypothetical protein chiPu_0025164 [Chiloscyllium punctatum]|uniref:Uncharacterized protein n=1 Tax=Chiloscyllium punctatum TaxID=137246 RepID=A0A401TFG0_CHIPU|nr:hypothetical protein [Chiloscyllium punctatum]